MAGYNADCRPYGAAGNAGKGSVLSCFRGYLSKLRFFLYAIVGHLFVEHRPEVAFFVNQKRLISHNINRVLSFVIENYPHRHQTRTNYIKSKCILGFFRVAVNLSSYSRPGNVLCIGIGARHFERHYLRFVACTSQDKSEGSDN